MKVRINTNEYLNTHGRMPKGYGGWVFWLETNDGNAIFQGGTGDYSEIKKLAITAATKLGVTAITVGS